MFTINRANMDKISKDKNSKTTLGTNNKAVFDTFRLTVLNIIEFTREYFIYDMAHFINNIDRWIANQRSNNTMKYQRGTIVFLDLGSQNFRYEPSYAHPCVVLADKKNKILIVPCSSKKYGTGFPEIIDATVANGFSSNTGIQSDSYRWVHKNRVISVVGKTDNSILNEMDKRILSTVPTYKLEVTKLTKAIEKLEDELQEANTKIEELNVIIEKSKSIPSEEKTND